MAYHKRYEDSYLDQEEEQFDGKNLKDSEKVVYLIQKFERTEKDTALMAKLTDRITLGAQMPGPMGKEAMEGLQLIAEAYTAESMPKQAIETWARLAEVAENLGNQELYYYATDKMTE